MGQFVNQINWVTKYFSIVLILLRSYPLEKKLDMQNVLCPERYICISCIIQFGLKMYFKLG